MQICVLAPKRAFILQFSPQDCRLAFILAPKVLHCEFWLPKSEMNCMFWHQTGQLSIHLCSQALSRVFLLLRRPFSMSFAPNGAIKLMLRLPREHFLMLTSHWCSLVYFSD